MQTGSKLVRRAEELIEREKYPAAEVLLMDALAQDPTNPEAYYLLGEALCKQSRFAESVAALVKADLLLPEHYRIHHLLGWALFMNKEVNKGREYLLKAFAKDSTDIRLLCDLAVVEMNTRDFAAAQKYALSALDIAPHDDLVLEVNSVVKMMSELSRDAIKV